MQSFDGKFYKTDVADIEQLFRLIQSIPSPKAEPFKLWLSELARERLQEIDDPKHGIERLMEYYHRKGYSESWINQRLKSIEVRKELTDEWEKRGIQKGQEFAVLKDVITQTWSGKTMCSSRVGKKRDAKRRRQWGGAGGKLTGFSTLLQSNNQSIK